MTPVLEWRDLASVTVRNVGDKPAHVACYVPISPGAHAGFGDTPCTKITVRVEPGESRAILVEQKR